MTKILIWLVSNSGSQMSYELCANVGTFYQWVIEEGGCTLIPFVNNTMAHNYCYHCLAYGN